MKVFWRWQRVISACFLHLVFNRNTSIPRIYRCPMRAFQLLRLYQSLNLIERREFISSKSSILAYIRLPQSLSLSFFSHSLFLFLCHFFIISLTIPSTLIYLIKLFWNLFFQLIYLYLSSFLFSPSKCVRVCMHVDYQIYYYYYLKELFLKTIINNIPFHY